MPASAYDSAIYAGLLREEEAARLFTDAAEIRAMLLVWGALARVQARLGLIPEPSGAAIGRAAMEAQIDPAALAAGAARSAVPVPALLEAFRREVGAPVHAAFVHWGATSQDVMDTGLALRLRRALDLAEARLGAVLARLGGLARRHADLPMAARTWGQAAVPTSFGAVCAGWGWPLLGARGDLARVRGGALRVSLGGAAGTLSAMGAAGAEVRAGLAAELGLGDPGHAVHSDRSGIAGLSGWISAVTSALGKAGEDLLAMAASGTGEVRLGAAGGSSAMPQKENPVGPSLLVALARVQVGLDGVLQGARLHRQQRDGAAWMAEWLVLPQAVLGLSRALALGEEILAGLEPEPAAMARMAGDDLGLMSAEALAYALAARMPRPEAQAEAAALVAEARASRVPLPELAARRHPGLEMAPSLGQAPAEARAFAAAASPD